MGLYFVETTAFTRRITQMNLEESLVRLQAELIANPRAGDIDAGTGSLRKVRMPDVGRRTGKRGGARVHYLYMPKHEVIYLMFVYAKQQESALTPTQKKALRIVVSEIHNEWDHRSRVN